MITETLHGNIIPVLKYFNKKNTLQLNQFWNTLSKRGDHFCFLAYIQIFDVAKSRSIEESGQ